MSERKRRERWLAVTEKERYVRVVFDDPNRAKPQPDAPVIEHVREVLPDDPDPEWVDELIEVCRRVNEADTIDGVALSLAILNDHLAKRGKK